MPDTGPPVKVLGASLCASPDLPLSLKPILEGIAVLATALLIQLVGPYGNPSVSGETRGLPAATFGGLAHRRRGWLWLAGRGSFSWVHLRCSLRLDSRKETPQLKDVLMADLQNGRPAHAKRRK